MRFGMLFVQKKDINDIRFHLFCYIRWFDLKGYGVTHSSVTSLMWFSIFNLIYIFTFKAGNFVPFREFGVSNGMFLTSVDFGWRAHILVLISTKPYRFDVSFMTFSVFVCRFHSRRSQQPNISSFRSLSLREWAIVLGDAFELKICFRAYQDFTQLNIRIWDCHEIQFDTDFGSVNIGKRVNANLNGNNVKSIYFIRFSHEIQLSMWLSNWIHRGSPLNVKDIWTL